MEKDNEIKGEWRAGIYDYGMFVENMRKLDDLRKKRAILKNLKKRLRQLLGFFQGLLREL